jgi:hypothetical protein
VNVIIGMVVILGLYLFPMYFVGHWYGPLSFWLITAVVGMVILKFTWYENLPDD